jgi:hypothetical protein
VNSSVRNSTTTFSYLGGILADIIRIIYLVICLGLYGLKHVDLMEGT